MKRREFITLLGGATAAWPLAARAQQSNSMRRIGVLMSTAADDPEGQARIAAFHQGLQQQGWTIGQNVWIDSRWPVGSEEHHQLGNGRRNGQEFSRKTHRMARSIVRTTRGASYSRGLVADRADNPEILSRKT